MHMSADLHAMFVEVAAGLVIAGIVWIITRVSAIPETLRHVQEWQERHEIEDDRRFTEVREDRIELNKLVTRGLNVHQGGV